MFLRGARARFLEHLYRMRFLKCLVRDNCIFPFLIAGYTLLPLAKTVWLADHYTVIKWVIVYFVSAGAFVAISRRLAIYLPSGKTMILALLLGLIKIAHVSINPTAVSLLNFYESLMFVGLVIFFFQKIQRPSQVADRIMDVKYPALLGAALVTVAAMWDLFHCRIQANNFSQECFAGRFGNINMLAEYLILLTPLIVYYFIKAERKSEVLSLGLLLSCQIFALYFSYSRSALLGLAI